MIYMTKKLTLLAFISSVILLSTGCATVFGGYKNKLAVENGSPPHAEVYLDGQKMGTAPLDQKIDKYLLQHGSLIELRSDGYVTDTIVVEREVHPYYTLADVLTGGIWTLVDVATGNLYRPTYGKIKYELKKEGSTIISEKDEN